MRCSGCPTPGLLAPIRCVGISLLVASSWVAACAPAARGPKAAPAATSWAPEGLKPAWIAPARLFVLPEEGEASYSFTDPDGSRRVIAHGMRLRERSDGSLQRAPDLLPVARPARPVALPERLGGGYVFYTADSSGTALWRAQDWTDKLQPLGRMDLQTSRVEAGFDRLYLVLEESGEVVAVEPKTGQALGLGPLPASPAYRLLSFADAWLGAAEVPLRGLLVTFDAGATWRRTGLGPLSTLGVADGKLVIGASGGPYELDTGGHLRGFNPESDTDPLFEAALAKLGLDAKSADSTVDAARRVRPLPPGPLGRRPLRTAVLHGWPDSPSTAVVIAHGSLGRVRLGDGKTLGAKSGALPVGEVCNAVALGDGFGFVCGRQGGGTTIYAFEPPLGIRPVLSFREPRFVSASGNGALVVRGGCGSARRTHPGTLAYCVRSRVGLVSEILVRGDLGVERVVGLADQRIAVLVPPRFGGYGTLTLIERDGASRSVKLQLEGMDSSTRRLLRHALWLDGFEQAGSDELRGWVVGADQFAGIRVSLDGKVHAGALAEPSNRALLAGRYALVVPLSGGPARQTVDRGQTWQTVELPWQLQDGRQVSSPDERGCTPVGCALGAWVRVGWDGRGTDSEPLAQAETPREIKLPARAGGSWRLRCVATGETSGAVAAGKRLDWGPFLGTPAPARAPAEIGLERGLESLDVLLHAYLWGARGADWRLKGQWLVRGASRFEVNRAVWSTRPTRSPWPDEATAATAFGKSVRGTAASSWRVALEPGGKAGALTVASDLFLLEAGRSIVHIKDASNLNLADTSGAVKVGDQWYVGSQDSSFRILRVDGDHVNVLGTYPLLGERQRRGTITATLVRSSGGDGLGIWVRANKLRGSQSHWYIYPVDTASGAVDEALELGPTELGTFPPPCGEGDEGWLLVGSPPVAPYVELPGGGPSVSRLEARILAGPEGLCVDALAADSPSDPPASRFHAALEQPPSSTWVPLALADQADRAKRWGFRCTR